MASSRKTTSPPQRKPLSKTLRFEVFKRDHFTCQYCGRSAPDVILEVDHITPVAEGGQDDIFNLITACGECNRGKGKKLLSDNAKIKKQRASLEEMAERKEQLDLMYQWKMELIQSDNRFAELIADEITCITGVKLSPAGIAKLKKYLMLYGFDEVRYATFIAFEKYYMEDNVESFVFAMDRIGGICYNRKQKQDNSNGE